MPQPPQPPFDPEAALAGAAARGIRATVWGIIASTVLAVVKVISGILGNSYAQIADGVEPGLDIMCSMVVWGSLRIASLPADPANKRIRSAGLFTIGTIKGT